MHYIRSTYVPNYVLDNLLKELTEAELKVLLIVIRQTLGWLNGTTGKRKCRDRITIRQFEAKTGLSKRTLSKAIQSLVVKMAIQVTGYDGKPLLKTRDRKGKSYLFYGLYQPENNQYITKESNMLRQEHKREDNKTNQDKCINTKRSDHTRHISTIMPDLEQFFKSSS